MGVLQYIRGIGSRVSTGMVTLIAVTLLLIDAPRPSHAIDVVVGPSGDVASIQEGVDIVLGAGGYNRVLVQPGTYYENLVIEIWSGGLEIVGNWGVAPDAETVTVIDGSHLNRVIRVIHSGGDLEFRALSVRNGYKYGSGGGGLFIQSTALEPSSISVVKCEVESNISVWSVKSIGAFDQNDIQAGTSRGPLEGYGGGVYFSAEGPVSFLLEDTMFRTNRCVGSHPTGAGAYVHGGDTTTITIRRCGFYDNSMYSPGVGGTAAGGGLAVVSAGETLVEQNTAIDNVLEFSTRCWGTGFYVWSTGSGSMTAERNQVLSNGGQSEFPCPQAGCTASASSAMRVRNMLVADSAEQGLGVWARDDASLELTNLTIANHDGLGFRANDDSSIPMSVYNSIIFMNSPDVELSTVIVAGNLIGVDPSFQEAQLRDYRLRPDSVAIDLGVLDPPTDVGSYDLGGSPRVLGPAIDCGAYESGWIFGDGFESGDSSAWWVFP